MQRAHPSGKLWIGGITLSGDFIIIGIILSSPDGGHGGPSGEK